MTPQFFHSTRNVREQNLLGAEPPTLINWGGQMIEIQPSEQTRRTTVLAQEQRIHMDNYTICFALETAAQKITGDERIFTRTYKTKFYTGHYIVTLVVDNTKHEVRFDLDAAEQDFDKAILDALSSVGIKEIKP